MGDKPLIRLKFIFFHDERNQDVDVTHIGEEMKRAINHPSERVVDIDISLGNEASSVFVKVTQRRWNGEELRRLSDTVIEWLKTKRFAYNINCTEWHVEAVMPDD